MMLHDAGHGSNGGDDSDSIVNGRPCAIESCNKMAFGVNLATRQYDLWILIPCMKEGITSWCKQTRRDKD